MANKTIDITQASGFKNLSAGSHAITIAAKDSSGGYGESTPVSCGNLTVYGITPTLTNVSAQIGNATNIVSGQTKNLSYYVADGYTLPDTVTVTGATGTWSIYNAYPISSVLTNCTIEDSSNYAGALGVAETMNLTVKATASHTLPASATITGCTGVYTKLSDTTASLVISNATAAVSITITGV